jgi:8-oxo-dGTP pyrophosphatase MutT (NUDIX family)
MDDRVRAADVPVRPAATVMLLRDVPSGLEVFMLQRTMSAAFARGQYVFPGGRVDDADHGDDFEPICDGYDDTSASAALGLEHGGLAWFVAAIRESFEEAGVLLARPTGADHVVRFDSPEVVERFSTARRAIHTGEMTLVELCVAEDLQLLTDRLHVVAHWLTPLGERRRFDTRFFVAHAPPSQQPLHDDQETIASLWIGPDEALAMWEAGELQMFPPTIACLRWLAGHATADAAIAATGTIPTRVEPRLVLDEDERLVGILVPGDPAYDTTTPPEFVVPSPR